MEKIKLYGKGSAYGSDYLAYINAYCDAYTALENYLISRKVINDYNYYPLIYIYIHILELTLKNIGKIYNIINDEKCVNHTHKLDKLWNNHVKNYLEIFNSRIKKQDILEISKLISDYQKIKNYEQIFRYPDEKIHPNKETEVSHLIKSTNIDRIRTLNYIFLQVEDLLHSLKCFGFNEHQVEKFENIALNSSGCISKSLLEEKFERNYKPALFILKQHYNLNQGYKLNFDKNCKIKPHYIDSKKIQVIINLCTQRTRRRNYLHKLMERPKDFLYSTWQEIMQEIEDSELNDINKKINDNLSLLNIEELEDIREIMSLGRGETTFFHYLQSFQHCRKQTVSEEEKKRLIHELVEKEPLGEYLKRGLATL